MHGGDIYDKEIDYDFSVSLNPLGPPKELMHALSKAGINAANYPDISSTRLRERLSEIIKCDQKYITMTAGASEAFMSIVHALRPEKGLVVSPSFYGYEHALRANDADIIRICEDQLFEEGIPSGLKEYNADIIFIGNPNNPTGRMIEKDKLIEMIEAFEKAGSVTVIDECFLPLSDGDDESLTDIINKSITDKLIIVRSFTKTFAIPGLRLGYMLCSSEDMNSRLRSNLPEWNISVPAQVAGLAVLDEEDCREWIYRSKEYILKEREYLREGLKRLGFEVIKSKAPFLLFKGREGLKDELIKQGILIRDCSDFDGLMEGCYRTGIRKHEDNKAFLDILGKIAWQVK